MLLCRMEPCPLVNLLTRQLSLKTLYVMGKTMTLYDKHFMRL